MRNLHSLLKPLETDLLRKETSSLGEAAGTRRIGQTQPSPRHTESSSTGKGSLEGEGHKGKTDIRKNTQIVVAYPSQQNTHTQIITSSSREHAKACTRHSTQEEENLCNEKEKMQAAPHGYASKSPQAAHSGHAYQYL